MRSLLVFPLVRGSVGYLREAYHVAPYTAGHYWASQGAARWHPEWIGQQVWFVDANNNIVTATIANALHRILPGPLLGADYTLLVFNSDLPSTITPLPVGWQRAGNATTYRTCQHGRLSVAAPPFYYALQPTSPSLNDHDTYIGGDSGSPDMVPMPNDQLVFVGGRSSEGPDSAIQADMNTLSRTTGLNPSQYQMTWYNPSVNAIAGDYISHGNWKGAHGADGYNVIMDSANYPAYAAVTPSGNYSYVWQSSTTDTRALQRGSSGRIAACWYSFSSFDIAVTQTDGQAHLIALYLLDWDNGNRAEGIDVEDTATGTVLDSQTVSGFTAGQYLVWNVAGNVTFHVTSTGGANAVVSGIFFGPGAQATFNSSDATTQGNWIGSYGTDGYNVVLDSASYPTYVGIVTPNGKTDLTWNSAPTDIRALVRASNQTTRIAACWTASDNFDIAVPFTDSNSHRLALYFVDWDQIGRSALIDVKDTASGTTLDSRAISAFSNGIYLTWDIVGNVTIHVVSTGGTSVLSGMFFGPPRH